MVKNKQSLKYKVSFNKPFIKRWIKALRHGNYEQTTGALRRPVDDCDAADPDKYSYCCLGVACDIAQKAVWGDTLMQSGVRFTNGSHSEWEDTELPNLMLDWIGITQQDQEQLIGLNDDLELNFTSIAAHLEEMIS